MTILENKNLHFCEKPKDLCVEPIDPDGFKKLLDQEDEEKESLDSLKPTSIPLSSPLQLMTNLHLENLSQNQVNAISESSLQTILDILSEKTSLLIKTLIQKELSETSVIIHDPTSILHEVEIIVSSYNFAQGSLNIEIKSCLQLQPLLHKQTASLLSQIEGSNLNLKINRLTLSLNGESKDKIKGSLTKKVTQSGHTSDDNQT